MRSVFTLGVIALVVLIPGVAFAAWNGAGTGTGSVKATTMPTGATPTASVTGRNVTVTWTASTIGGSAVSGYTVKRYDAGTLTAQTVGSGCSGTISALTCTEAQVPAGSWKYSVTPRRNLWIGTEGSKGSTVTIASASLSWTSSTTVTALPSTLTGTLAGYATGETVTFRLDNASSGTVLTGSISPDPVPTNGAVTFGVTIPSGTANGSHAVYAVGSLGTQTSGVLTVHVLDTTPPTVSASVVNKSTGDTPGFLKPGGQYYVYASATDPGSPASGISSVTANVTTITTGTTAAAMSAGSYTVGGVTYTYRSALLTASGSLTAGAKTFTITATDVAGNSTTQGGFSVTVDTTAPSASDIQTTNVAGGTSGQAETGDTMVFTFSEPIDLNSILAGWNGSATTVTFRLNSGGGSNDNVTVFDAANTTQLPLGSVNLGRKDYAGSNINFTGSTMVVSGSSITITLGTTTGAPTAAGNTGSLTWTPSAMATDRAGNACSTAAKTETGAADKDF